MAGSRLEKVGTIFTRVEGLLRSGGMRIEDRQLWWDVCRAFPPTVEPTFGREVPANPIKPIFYEEDVIRAKYHKSGHQLGTVSLLDVKRKSNAQKLIEIYKKISSEHPGDSASLYNKALLTLQDELLSNKDDQNMRLDEKENVKKERNVATQFAEGSKIREETIKNIFKE